MPHGEISFFAKKKRGVLLKCLAELSSTARKSIGIAGTVGNTVRRTGSIARGLRKHFRKIAERRSKPASTTASFIFRTGRLLTMARREYEEKRGENDDARARRT